MTVRKIAFAALLATAAIAAAPDLEDAADLARRAAAGALRGQNRLFFETLDADRILEARLGARPWAALTPRQRERLRRVVRESFAASLAGTRAPAGDISWSAASETPDGASVLLGLRFGDRLVKTHWSLRRVAPGAWRIEDVTLSDPGISLARGSLAALGPAPVRERDRRGDARRIALLYVAVLAGIGVVVAVFRRRLALHSRTILYLTAAAPAIVIAVGGALAVARSLSERYELAEAVPSNPWDRWLRLAREAERGGAPGTADALWARALAAGAPPGPLAYERGTLARERGDVEAARRQFRIALAARDPAPGAARELARVALAEGKSADARDQIAAYLAATGPDPDALSIQAVAEVNLGSPQKALQAIGRARELVGGGARGAELEARVRARAGDAAGAVAALRASEPGRALDREALRADPAFLPIATEPAWVAFVNEPPPERRPTPSPTAAPKR